MASSARGRSRSAATSPAGKRVAGLKSPELIVADLRSRLDDTWAQTVLAECGGRSPGSLPDGPTVDDSGAPVTVDAAFWPHAFPIGSPSPQLLTDHFAAAVTVTHEWRDWSTRHGLAVRYKGRKVMKTYQEIPTHLLVPDIDTAARLTDWQEMLQTARTRASRLTSTFPRMQAPARALRETLHLSQVDFDLLCRAAAWFVARDAHGDVRPMTPRQIPIEGMQAKWLNTRHALLRNLSGLNNLMLLPPHPPRINFTYLDPNYLATDRRRHDSATVGDHAALAYLPKVVLISENKDTAIHFPKLEAGIAVEGVGRGGATAAAFAWITGAAAVFYWGDMDADGLEILDGFRAAGVPARSLLMDWQAYEQWERFGTNVDKHGNALLPRQPREVPHLSSEERGLYEALCSETWERNRRIEQERVPLPLAASTLLHALSKHAMKP